jgi:serine phosphatase RsbU (regulator of sigma subunit)
LSKIHADTIALLRRKLYRFLSSSIRGSLVYEDVRKSTLINIFAFGGIFYLLFYAYRMYILNDVKLSYIYLLCVAVIVVMQVYLQRRRKIALASHVLVFGLFCLELFFLYRNGHTRLSIDSYYIFPGLYWYYIFPPFSLFLLGRKVGSMYNGLLVLITALVFLIQSPLTELYDIEFKVRFLSVYTAIFFFAFFYENIRHVTFGAFQRTNEKSVKYLQRISVKNRVLKRKNEDLQMLTEEVRVQNEYLKELNDALEERNNKIILQNVKLEEQQSEIVAQRDLLLVQKHNITDSILYASHIQKAMLPNENTLRESLADFFILYKPRDIIGGDFYYVKRVDSTVFVAVADCTGHGVPGALLSMLGISYLNEIIHGRELAKANMVLTQMREKLKHAMHQGSQPNESKDGIDMALCAIDLKSLTLQFAGANNPIYIYRNAELHKFKADRMPVGVQFNQRPEFTNQEFQLQKGDCIYLFTDGFTDQLNGVTRRKYSLKRFQGKLQELSAQRMDLQQAELDASVEQWKAGADQTDDILVVGLRI